MPVLRAPFISLISPSPFSSSSSHLDPIGGFESRNPHPTLLFGKVTDSGSYGGSRRLGSRRGPRYVAPRVQEKYGNQTRTHYDSHGLVGAAELKYRGCDAPRATADGAGSTFNNVGISALPNVLQYHTKVSGNAGKRGRGESKILPES